MMSNIYEMEMKVRVAFADWSAEPDRLSKIKNLRFAIEQYQGSVIEDLINEDQWTAKREEVEGAKQLYLGEAQDLAEDKKCKTCSGSRTISIPVTHPTNPNLDSWTTHPCHCTRIY